MQKAKGTGTLNANGERSGYTTSDAKNGVPTSIYRVRHRAYLALLLLVFTIMPIYAQSDDESPPPRPVITADNVTDLAPSARIDFDAPFFQMVPPSPNPNADTPSEPPIMGTPFASGWFAYEPGGRYAVMTADNDLWVIDADYARWYVIEAPVNADGVRGVMVDATFGTHSALRPLYAVYSDGPTYTVAVEDGGLYGNPLIDMRAESEYVPAALWVDCPTDNAYDCIPWLELIDPMRSETQIVGLPSNNEIEGLMESFTETFTLPADADLQTAPYNVADDPDALIRVGRIEPPYAVTASPEGAVKRWDLGTGEVTAEASVENGPAVFGQLSANGRYFVWRDPMSTQVNVLDFDTGENQVVADLDGDYAQFFFVTDDGGTVIATHVNDEPVVVAWDVATGERYELGLYRECSRELDMARLVENDTMLVIGCDTGLEMWAISE